MSSEQDHEETPTSPEIHFEPVVTLPKINVKTFEENEEEMIKMRAKLFRYTIGQHDTSPEWKERGVGDVKILKSRGKHSYRLVMRREKTLKVCANHYLSKDMELKPNCGSERAWVWNVAADYADEEPQKETLAIRFANAENAKKFKEVFDSCKEKVGTPIINVESEKLANELESLKVNEDGKTTEVGGDDVKTEGTTTEEPNTAKSTTEETTGEEPNTKEPTTDEPKTEEPKADEPAKSNESQTSEKQATNEDN